MKIETQLLLEIDMEYEELITTKQAYLAENKQREFLGRAMAYSDGDIFMLGDKIKALREKLIKLGEQ